MTFIKSRSQSEVREKKWRTVTLQFFTFYHRRNTTVTFFYAQSDPNTSSSTGGYNWWASLSSRCCRVSELVFFFYVTFCWLHTLRILCYIILTLTILGLTIMGLLTWNIYRRRPACRGPVVMRMMHNIIWNIYIVTLKFPHSFQTVCMSTRYKSKKTIWRCKVYIKKKCLLGEAQASRGMVYLEYKESIPSLNN